MDEEISVSPEEFKALQKEVDILEQVKQLLKVNNDADVMPRVEKMTKRCEELELKIKKLEESNG